MGTFTLFQCRDDDEEAVFNVPMSDPAVKHNTGIDPAIEEIYEKAQDLADLGVPVGTYFRIRERNIDGNSFHRAFGDIRAGAVFWKWGADQ